MVLQPWLSTDLLVVWNVKYFMQSSPCFDYLSVRQGEDVGTGLLTYPLLMASDILLYQVGITHDLTCCTT